MIFRDLDSNGDWEFGQGFQNYAINEAAIDLNIKTSLYSWLNDCFFALTSGIDWANLLGSKNKKSTLDQQTKLIILSSYGVTGILSFNSTLNLATRAYVANYMISTIFTPVSGNISLGTNNA